MAVIPSNWLLYEYCYQLSRTIQDRHLVTKNVLCIVEKEQFGCTLKIYFKAYNSEAPWRNSINFKINRTSWENDINTLNRYVERLEQFWKV